MPDPIVTNVDTGNVIFEDADFFDELLTFGGAGTVLEGTILARLTASGKLEPFVKGGAGGLETPIAITANDVVAAGAGDIPIRAMETGKVRKERLIILADGDDSNVDGPVRDQLRNVMIFATKVLELNIPDNQ